MTSSDHFRHASSGHAAGMTSESRAERSAYDSDSDSSSDGGHAVYDRTTKISSADPPDKHTQTGFTSSPSPSSPRYIPSSGRKHPSRNHKEGLVTPGFTTTTISSPSIPGTVGGSCEGGCGDGMECSNKVCKCETYHVPAYGNHSCLVRVVLSGRCRIDAQCSHIDKAICHGNCECQDEFIKDGEVCIEKKAIGDACKNAIQCSWTNAACSSENKTCVCLDGFRKREGRKTDCIEIKLGDSCGNDTHCSLINNSTCSSAGTCECQEGFRTYGKACFERKVGGVCYEDLICELNNTECSEGRCNCLEAYHQSGKTCIQTRLDDNCTSKADSRFVNGTCNEDSKTCTCGRFQKPVEDKCVEKVLVFGDLCDTDEQCKGNLTNGVCIDHSCYCDKFHKYDRETNGCILNTESLCNEQSHCDQYPNTTCLKEYCMCYDNTTLRNGVCPEPYNSGSTISFVPAWMCVLVLYINLQE